jgi:F420-dependent oxidoreductase-like protein
MTMFDAVFGVHAGLQHTTADELRSVWKRIEDLGYGWISIWDHFDGATGHPDDAACLEAVAMHAALACSTERVRCGSLVYSIGYRHPAVLAKAITTIDQLSGGRADMGIGAGWAQIEYQAYGIPFPEVRTRMDQLEEGIQCLRGLLHHEVTDFEGDWFTLTNARNEPRPLQDKLPIWIGGGGEKRTLRIAARSADGWNVPFISPSQFAHKNQVLDQHCDAVGRDPREIKRAINAGLAWSEESLQRQFGAIAEFVRPGVLTGSDQQVIDTIGAYVEAGADQVNIALRAPFDLDAIDRLSATLGLERT